MKKIVGLLKILSVSLLVVTCGSSTTRAQAVCSNATDSSATNAEIIQSLQSIFYRCGALPPMPNQAEIAKLTERKADPDLKAEAEFLNKTFGTDIRLQVWAGRDHDRDGVIDFRVSKSGEFRENDTDVDCDGISNVLDSTPYGEAASTDPAVCIKEPGRKAISADVNENGLPDHIDWRLLDSGSDTPRPADLQEGLFRDYGIALVDRRARVSSAMANELDHIIRHVYSGQISADHKALRVITADTDVCGQGNWAWASAHSATLFIYPSTLTLNPFMRAEVLIHEIAHTLQFARDYTAGHLYWLRSWNGWQTEGFHAFAKTLGWEPVRDYKKKSYGYYQLYVPNCAGNETGGNFYPYHWQFKGESSRTWQETWDFYLTNDGLPVSTNMPLKDRHMVGRYAFTDAWEWHAEYTAAYALNRMLEAANHFCSPGQVESLRGWLHSQMDDSGWNFNHENARGLDVYENQIANQFHVSDDAWIGLARYFVRASNPDVCGLQPLP